ncbi:barwin-like endoglucanase, partial [Ceraceosorus guamensis]
TYYLQKGVAGACGKVNSEEALIIALPSAMYAGGKHCGRKVKITRKGGKGQTVTATVADECPTCTTSTSLDLSKGAFAKIATKEEGQVDIEWNFAN